MEVSEGILVQEPFNHSKEQDSYVDIASTQESLNSEAVDSFSLCDEQMTSFSLVDNVSVSSFSLVSIGSAFSISGSEGDPPTLKPSEKKNLATITASVKSPVCYMCQNEKPLVKLMRNCKHSSSCYDCLRQRYIMDAQQGIENFPLTCFYPGCHRVLRDTQVRLLVRSTREAKEHFRMQKSAKKTRRFTSLHSCPTCNADQRFCLEGSGGTSEVVCWHCDTRFIIKRLPRDLVLALSGAPVAKCPACGYVIVKSEGCDHMTCFCSHDFSFDKEKYRFAYNGKEIQPQAGYI
mmetsp:Transcript_35155/g.52490  ORF Transcript_35155/g.52490 Transcript_35155/m.52490 type:complete len:291 (-) Transcript_35155:153-1025(-)